MILVLVICTRFLTGSILASRTLWKSHLFMGIISYCCWCVLSISSWIGILWYRLVQRDEPTLGNRLSQTDELPILFAGVLFLCGSIMSEHTVLSNWMFHCYFLHLHTYWKKYTNNGITFFSAKRSISFQRVPLFSMQINFLSTNVSLVDSNSRLQ